MSDIDMLNRVLGNGARKVVTLKDDGSAKKSVEVIESPEVIKVVDFTGKKLKRTKSVITDGQQLTIESGTKWEDMNIEVRNLIAFSDADF